MLVTDVVGMDVVGMVLVTATDTHILATDTAMVLVADATAATLADAAADAETTVGGKHENDSHC